MFERFLARLSRLHVRGRPLLLGIGVLIGFLLVLATQLNPPDPESRLPDRYRLEALIKRQQDENEQRRGEVADIRSQIDVLRSNEAHESNASQQVQEQIESAETVAGLVAVKGQGFTVSLNDSSLDAAPTGNVNDLVIHSQDIQAVVNAMWNAGAEAVSLNGQRVVSTSAVLCVGNTLLINGTVHAPPYEVSAIGADKDEFSKDALIRQLRSDADRFGLRISTSANKQIQVPAYVGPILPKYAQSTSAS